MALKVLICGLSGSGKTTLANQLQEVFHYPILNGDVIRTIYDDWDFTPEGRLRQAARILSAADNDEYEKVILDFIAPTHEIRDIVKPDFIIWMNTTQTSQFPDTDIMFIPPYNADIIITSFDYNINAIEQEIRKKYDKN